MGGKIRKGNERNVKQSNGGIAVALVTGLFTLIGALFMGWSNLVEERMKELHDIELYGLQNDYEQHINVKSSIIEDIGIEYVQYDFTSDPIMAGYHVLVCPYAICEKGNNRVYLPVTEQFTQREYVADENGHCRLLRENTTEDFLEMAASVVNYSIEVKCLVAIQFVKDEELQREVYDLRDGKLVLADQNIVIEVLKAWENENSIKIDMRVWPYFDQQILEEIFD